MSLIHVENVRVLNNPAKFLDPFQFEITFECIHPGPKEDIEWKLVYVGSAEDDQFDQELDSVLVGPLALGKNKFVFQAPPPDIDKIPHKDLLEVTAVILVGIYKNQEFIRIGYFVRNYLEGQEHRSLEELIPSSTNTKVPLPSMAPITNENKSANSVQVEVSNKGPQSQPSQILPIASSFGKDASTVQDMDAELQQEEKDDPELKEAEEEEEEELEAEDDINDMEEVPDFKLPEPEGPIDISKVFRNINPMPRVTRFQIPWDTTPQTVPSNLSNHSVDGEVLPLENSVEHTV